MTGCSPNVQILQVDVPAEVVLILRSASSSSSRNRIVTPFPSMCLLDKPDFASNRFRLLRSYTVFGVLISESVKYLLAMNLKIDVSVLRVHQYDRL